MPVSRKKRKRSKRPTSSKKGKIISNEEAKYIAINSEIINSGVNNFDFNRSLQKLREVYYENYQKPIPKNNKTFKELIYLRKKDTFKKDDFKLFVAYVRCLFDFLDKPYVCPKCKHRAPFIPTRYKVIKQLFKTQNWVRAEQNRTIGCQNCSFNFSPLAFSSFRNLKTDLRKWFFLTVVLEIDPIVTSLQMSKILNVTHTTAKNLIERHTIPMKESTSIAQIEKKYFFNDRIENHYWGIIMEQFYNNLSQKPSLQELEKSILHFEKRKREYQYNLSRLQKS